jgi:hypothetical protein
MKYIGKMAETESLLSTYTSPHNTFRENILLGTGTTTYGQIGCHGAAGD